MDRDALLAQYLAEKEERRARNLGYAEKGVFFADLDTAYIDEGVKLDPGVQVGPCVRIRGETRIGKNTTVGAGTYLENATIGAECAIGQGCRIIDTRIEEGVSVLSSVLVKSKVAAGACIGPFAYLRPDSRVGRDVKIGDFVEVKNSVIGDGTKVSHLTYVGDADLGKDINLGCGVVFVNYDGEKKHRSRVGDGAFIGCNANIISPVEVGAGAYVAAGTTVTEDVPPESLTIGRTRETVIDGWKRRKAAPKKKKAKEKE
jgi:bifunctional UDP-N-acetylglucosamine pyrophosphorylase/glucosamine-1-phosphate N-acetyltransferase